MSNLTALSQGIKDSVIVNKYEFALILHKLETCENIVITRGEIIGLQKDEINILIDRNKILNEDNENLKRSLNQRNEDLLKEKKNNWMWAAGGVITGLVTYGLVTNQLQK
jgi:regulator of replication initiation timing